MNDSERLLTQILKGSLLDHLVHDIRNSLATFSLRASQLEDICKDQGSPESGELRDISSSIQMVVEQLSHATGMLKGLPRGRGEQVFQVLSLNKLLKPVLERYRDTLSASRDPRLVERLELPVWCQPVLMQYALNGLLYKLSSKRNPVFYSLGPEGAAQGELTELCFHLELQSEKECQQMKDSLEDSLGFSCTRSLIVGQGSRFSLNLQGSQIEVQIAFPQNAKEIDLRNLGEYFKAT